jgi:adenine/guanine/hypoxanthine permease
MVLGAIAVFMIDRRFLWAAGYAAFGAALAAVGLIHGEKVVFFADLEIALGYAFLALTCIAFHALRVPERVADPADPVDVEDAAEAAARRAPKPVDAGDLERTPVPA